MKKQYIYIVCWLVVGGLVEGCCYLESCCTESSRIEYDYGPANFLFQPPEVTTHFEDSLGNTATLVYETKVCEYSEWEEFDGTSDDCEFMRHGTCAQTSHIDGTNDMAHTINEGPGTASFNFVNLALPFSIIYDMAGISHHDSLAIRNHTYYDVMMYEVDAELNAQINHVVFSESYAILKVKLNNGTVWERLP